jgi:hypothetical protein
MRARLWMVAGAAAMWACGGATFAETPDGGGGDGGSGSSSGSSGSSGSSSGSGGSSGSSGGSGSSSGSSSGGTTGPLCPASAPAGGTPCPAVGLECEYGTNPNPECNYGEMCTVNGWSYPAPTIACPPGTCPATYADVPQGQTCMPSTLDCAYSQGQCNCASTVPVAGPNPEWQCSTPAAGCANPRPRIGSACMQPGLDCDYGHCTGGVELVCSGGIWSAVDAPCPI